MFNCAQLISSFSFDGLLSGSERGPPYPRKKRVFTLLLISRMSDNQPSGTLGGMIASLFRGKTNDDGSTGGFTSTHKVLSGALLAAGAAYLYKKAKGKQAIGN